MSESRSAAFDLLAEPVQRWVWRQRWPSLHDIQERAVRPILEGNDVLISSATASGKTEAAFLPICSALEDTATTALGVLYIAPLKALINDQRIRLESLFDVIDGPVTPWHGDIAAHVKRRLVERPRGALLITPESLEALFVTRGTAMPGLAQHLRFIVVDELHAFIGTERGRQLQSLMHRLELAAGRPIARIGLSATLGDTDLAAEFLRPRRGVEVKQITSTAQGREVKLQVRGYIQQRSQAPVQAGQASDNSDEEMEELAASDDIDIAQHLFRTLRGTTNLAFANRRSDVELYADLLRRLADQGNLPNEFFPHHGSLSRDIREDAEDRLRGPRPTTVVATTTLEMGIDIGSVDSIAQIGPPSSVASLKQRLGRSGRTADAPSIIRIYIQEEEINENSSVPSQLRISLVQTVAMIRLLVQGWVEPPPEMALHLSTLVQQLLSLIAQHGGVRAADAFHALCATGPFASVERPTFAQLLRDLASHELITQTHDGTIVLDLGGERLVNHYDFYAAFSSPDEWRLVSGTRTLGTLPVTYPLVIDSFVTFAGRRWKVMSVDEERRVAELTPAAGGRVPWFVNGGALIHDRVRQEMRRVYLDSDMPSFLDANGRELLAEARSTFRRMELDRHFLLPQGRNTWVFPWVGDRALNTLGLLFLSKRLEFVPYGPTIYLADMSAEFAQKVAKELASLGRPDLEGLATDIRNKRTEKHHWYLSDELLGKDYASSRLDVDRAWEVVQALT
ncbi:MAG: DEAD/DEAH box helicase [Chloroflexota bacterium]|nr:DEAD/DEAH box helicase [Chloroflexota bacterium]MDE2894198.1 DEAD/DEAH box helicase [Chloroflexota bacterium]